MNVYYCSYVRPKYCLVLMSGTHDLKPAAFTGNESKKIKAYFCTSNFNPLSILSERLQQKPNWLYR